MKFFPTNRFYGIAISLAILFFFGFYFEPLFVVVRGLTIFFLVLVIADLVLLFGIGGRVALMRSLPDRFSNGDDNYVQFELKNEYPFPVSALVLDELAPEFQQRDLAILVKVSVDSVEKFEYSVKPTARGEYEFGKTNVLVVGRIGFTKRRFKFGDHKVVKVYPSFLNLEKYELSAISQTLKLSGQKRMKRVGQSTEFDHIKEYVIGDDPRHINWNASARKSSLMINHYIDERSQAIYSVIDKGRPMKMPFEGMTLLDYSINASLVLSNVAIKKGDQAGLVTFQHKPQHFIPARKRNLQINLLLEALYKEQTQFNEPDLATLYWFLAQKIKQRSLLMLYTNFESMYTLERQLPYLKMINRHHLLLLVFFRNTELDDMIEENATSLIDVYNKSIAKQIADEKASIQKVLQQHGIMSLYTAPAQLNVNVINKYIEIKTKRLI